MSWALLILALLSQAEAKAERKSVEWLLSDKLRYEDLTPRDFRYNPVFIDLYKNRILFAQNNREKVPACPGKQLFWQNRSGRMVTSPHPELNCIAGLRVISDKIYVHVRTDSKERLIEVQISDLDELKIENALSDSLDGKASNTATARMKWEMDKLRRQGNTSLNRSTVSTLYLQLHSETVDLFWVISTDQENLCLKDSFSLLTRAPLVTQPTKMECEKREKRRLSHLFSTANGENFLLWQGGRTEMGRIVRSTKRDLQVIGSETIIDPPEWKSVRAEQFAIRSPGESSLLPDGFISYESSRKFTFDDPFTFFYDINAKTFFRLPYLSLINQQILWIRALNEALLVSFIDTDNNQAHIWWISEKAKGDLVSEL